MFPEAKPRLSTSLIPKEYQALDEYDTKGVRRKRKRRTLIGPSVLR